MRWKRKCYVAHRWVGLLVSLQLLAWSVGGLMFSILDIDAVRGDAQRSDRPPPAVRFDNIRVSPAEAASRARAVGRVDREIVQTKLRERFGRTVYELYDEEDWPLAVVDANSGEVRGEISVRRAERAALDDFAPRASVRSATLIDGDAPLEYRGKRTPAYQVILDHPSEPRIYVCAVTGEILARRNQLWRWFDFFWMLHIMDYGAREDFNHRLLTAMSALAVFTAASGLVLWAFRWRLVPFTAGKKR